MKAATPRVGIKDVAQHAGVSPSSVSRVLDGHRDVSESMRRRVLDAVHTLGYTPDPLAQSLRTGTTMTIGFVAGDTSNPLLARVTLASQITLRAAGYSMLVANSGNDADLEDANIRLLKNRKIDGMLLSVADETVDALRTQLTDSPIPVVLVDREVAGVKVSAIRSDHALGITQAADHLIALGHQRVALVNGNPRVRPSRERANALRRAFAVVPDADVTVSSGTFSETHGYDAAMSLLQRAQMPTAMIAGSNQLFVGVLRAVRDLGLRIPDDLSLVTCDASPLAELYVPEIATIVRDVDQLGRVSAEVLVNLMSGGQVSVLTLPTEFNPGASCAPPPARLR